MRNHIAAAAGLCVGLVAFGAQASTFDFTETFAGNYVVTGSFDGTANGNVITGLSNIAASVNGVAFNKSGALFGASWDSTNLQWQSGGAVVSFDGLENNFLFVDIDYPASYNYTNFVYDVSSLQNSELLTPANEFADVKTSWSVTAQNVPEPASMLLLAGGFAVGGLVRRRGTQPA